MKNIVIGFFSILLSTLSFGAVEIHHSGDAIYVVGDSFSATADASSENFDNPKYAFVLKKRNSQNRFEVVARQNWSSNASFSATLESDGEHVLIAHAKNAGQSATRVKALYRFDVNAYDNLCQALENGEQLSLVYEGDISANLSDLNNQVTSAAASTRSEALLFNPLIISTETGALSEFTLQGDTLIAGATAETVSGRIPGMMPVDYTTTLTHMDISPVSYTCNDNQIDATYSTRFMLTDTEHTFSGMDTDVIIDGVVSDSFQLTR